MTRIVTIGAAQLGPIAREERRRDVVARLIAFLEQAKAAGCDLVVYPELALTTFFPRWWFEDPRAIDAFFEREMPGPETLPLFAAAERLGLGFCLGYAELTPEGRRFNTAILVEKSGAIVGKYRKVHLPGHAEHEPRRRFQHLEKRYFEVGDLGFPVFRAFGGLVGMLICNDRRWPEAWRVLGLQGVELVLIGYNTPIHNPPAPEHDRLADFHNHLVMQAGAYQNGTWAVGVGKGGIEEDVPSISGSCIIAPSGEIVAQVPGDGDQLIVARCDLDLTRSYKETIFDFARHRQPGSYSMIVERRGAAPPP
jgi:predicted amidohydrolase